MDQKVQEHTVYKLLKLMYFHFFLGISATSEDIPNKIEDLRSECSSDFGGKDSVISPDGEDSVHGIHTQIDATQESA